MNLYYHSINQFILLISSWDTANFRVLGVFTPIYDHSHFNNFQSTLISMNLYDHAKKQAFSSFYCRDTVDFTILQSYWPEGFWPISQVPKLFKIWDFTKHTVININFHYRPNWKKKLNFSIHSKNPRLVLFSTFWGQKYFFQKMLLSCTTPYGLLTLFWAPQKAKAWISSKLADRRTGKPYSKDLSGPSNQGFNKRII